MSRIKRFRKKACENCGTKERLQLHHKNLDSWDHRPENLETLCISCHLKLHHLLRKNGIKIQSSEVGKEAARKRQRNRYKYDSEYRRKAIERAKLSYKENFVAMSMYQYLMKLQKGILGRKGRNNESYKSIKG